MLGKLNIAGKSFIFEGEEGWTDDGHYDSTF